MSDEIRSEDLFRMRQQGMTSLEIAQKTNMSKSAVIGRIWRHQKKIAGINYRTEKPGYKTKYTDDFKAIVCADYLHGVAIKEIEKKHKISKWQLYCFLGQCGIKPNRFKKWRDS